MVASLVEVTIPRRGRDDSLLEISETVATVTARDAATVSAFLVVVLVTVRKIRTRTTISRKAAKAFCFFESSLNIDSGCVYIFFIEFQIFSECIYTGRVS